MTYVFFGSPTVAAITSCVSTSWGFLQFAALRCFPDKQQPFLCKLWAFILNHVRISWLLTQDSRISYSSSTLQWRYLFVRSPDPRKKQDSYEFDAKIRGLKRPIGFDTLHGSFKLSINVIQKQTLCTWISFFQPQTFVIWYRYILLYLPISSYISSLPS